MLTLQASSEKPICFNLASLVSKLLLRLITSPPGSLANLLFSMAEFPDRCGGRGGNGKDDSVWERERGNVEDAARKPGMNLGVFFGGGGGGRSSEEFVLPVPCLEAACEPFVLKVLCWYFSLMKRSIAPSTSSMSIGMFGRTLRGLKERFEAAFPVRLRFCQMH